MKKIAPFVNRAVIILGRETIAERAQMAIVPIMPFIRINQCGFHILLETYWLYH